MNLRPYQDESLSASHGAFHRGVWSQALVLATGLGKTVVFSHLPRVYASWLDQFATTQQKMLVLAHRDTLLDQAARKIQQCNPDLRVGVEQAGQRVKPMDDVVVASVPTLVSTGARRLARLNPDDFRIIVVDEAHRTPAESYQTVLRHFGVAPPVELTAGLHARSTSEAVAEARQRVRHWWLTNWPNRLLLGVTATPSRSDAVGLEWTYRELVYERSLRWGVENGFLAPLTGWIVQTSLSLDDVAVRAGDFATNQLAAAVNTPARNRATVQAWQQVQTGGRVRRTLVFCVNVAHAEAMAAEFRRAGVAADSIAGVDEDRHDRMGEFARGGAQGGIDVLCNCALLTEGVDLPFVDCIVMAAPTKSQIKYVQCVGRGTRLSPETGKTDCLVLDVVDDSRKWSLQTSGDLFGLPRRFNAQGRDLLDMAQEADVLRAANPTLVLGDDLTPDVFTVVVRQHDLWTVQTSASVQAHAKLSWVEVAPERFVLTMPSRAQGDALIADVNVQVAITGQTLGGFDISIRGPRVESLGVVDDLRDAFLRAERWVEHHRPDAMRMLARDANWRGRAPTPKQIARLRRLGAPIPDGLTRGQASEMLDSWRVRQ